MPKVKLWFDNGTLGVKDGADVQIFSGAAYATPGVIDEVIPAGPSGTVTFDNLAVTAAGLISPRSIARLMITSNVRRLC